MNRPDAPARLLIDALGVPYIQYSFRSQLVFRCRAHAVVNGPANLISLLKPVAVSVAAPSAGRHRSASQICPAELALYSLTGRANSPFHAEPVQVRDVVTCDYMLGHRN